MEAAAAAGVLGAQAAIASLSDPAQPAGPVDAALIDTATNAVPFGAVRIAPDSQLLEQPDSAAGAALIKSVVHAATAAAVATAITDALPEAAQLEVHDAEQQVLQFAWSDDARALCVQETANKPAKVRGECLR